MPNVVSITASEGVVVISQRLGDRERHENGIDFVEPGVTRHFIVDDGQSLAVDHRLPPPPPAPPSPEVPGAAAEPAATAEPAVKEPAAAKSKGAAA